MLRTIQKYVGVTKPGIICGNLISAAAGFFFASRGDIDAAVLLTTLVGISLVVASGCVFNNCIDRDMDRKMARTCSRTIARGRMSPRTAVVYASLLGTAGTAMLWTVSNMLAVAIVLTGFTIYVVVYSLLLKRNCVYGTLIGSLAGAAPPLAGYCAVSGRFDAAALILLLIFSLWQMPHCYAISIFRFDDYAAAAIPVPPAKLKMKAVKRHIFGYSLAFIAATLLPALGGYSGYGYLAAAAVLGIYWLHLTWSGFRTSADRIWARKLFVFSILNIFILSIMLSVNCTLPVVSDMMPMPAP